MEEFKLTLVSCTPKNKKAKPSFLGFYLVNQQVDPQFIQINSQQQDSQSITLIHDESSEHVYLELNIFENSWFFGRKLRAYTDISLEKLRSYIGKMDLRLKDDDNKTYAMLAMKVTARSLQPLANLPQTINYAGGGSSTIEKSISPTIATQPGDVISITDVIEQLRSLNVHESESLAGFLQSAFAQHRLRMSHIKTIKILQEKVEELGKTLNESSEYYRTLESDFAKISKKNESLESRLAKTGNKSLKELEEKNHTLENESAANTNKYRKELHLLECQLSEERQNATEATANFERLERIYNENKVTLQQREKEIIQLHKKATLISQQPMETGIYPLGEVDPSKIAENWRNIYEDLHYILVETLGQQSQSPASEQYKKLTYYDMRASNYPRHHSYVIVREISSLLCKFYRRIVVNIDGSFESNREDDLVDRLMKYIMTTSNRCDFAKRILGFLAPPNDIDAGLPLIFEKLPGGPKIFLEEIFKEYFEYLHQITTAYNISTEEVDTYLKAIIYGTIYTTFQMSVIGSNFVSFWSNSLWDRDILNVPQHDDDSLARYTETFNNSLETVELPMAPEDPHPHVLFTVFPGCLYTSTSGEVKVIERSQVVCCKNPNTLL